MGEKTFCCLLDLSKNKIRDNHYSRRYSFFDSGDGFLRGAKMLSVLKFSPFCFINSNFFKNFVEEVFVYIAFMGVGDSHF